MENCNLNNNEDCISKEMGNASNNVKDTQDESTVHNNENVDYLKDINNELKKEDIIRMKNITMTKIIYK